MDEEELDLADLQITAALLRSICEAIEASRHSGNLVVNLNNLGCGSLTSLQLNKLLLEAASPYSGDHRKIAGTPLNLQVLKVLLDHGADLEYRDSTNYTPLLRSLWRGQIDEMEYLLQRGARRYYGTDGLCADTYLWRAVQDGYHEKVRVLLKYGDKRQPPLEVLYYAAIHRDLEMVKMLVDGCADPLGETSDLVPIAGPMFLTASSVERDIHALLVLKNEDRLRLDEFLPQVGDIVITFRKRMGVLAYLLQQGFPVPIARDLAITGNRGDFVALVEFFRMVLLLRLTVHWDGRLWDSRDRKHGFSGGAELFAALLRRNRRPGNYLGEGTVLRSVDAVQGVSHGDYVVPRLADICVVRVRECLSSGAGTLKSAVGGLMLPWTMKRVILMTDLDERIDVLRGRLSNPLSETQITGHNSP